MNRKSLYDAKSRLHNKLVAGAALVAGAGTFAGGAFAAAGDIDVSTVLAVIAAVAVAAASIGTAVLGMKFGIKAYQWIRGAA